MLTPLSLLSGLLLGLLSLAFPLLGAWLLWRAAHPPVRFVREVRREHVRTGEAASDPLDSQAVATEVSAPRPLRWSERWRDPAVLAPLLLGAALLLLPLYGRHLIQYAFRKGADEPVMLHGEARELDRDDGTKIHVEFFGPQDAPTILLTHGWGTDSGEWYYAKKQLAGRFRLIVWDLPGLGETQGPRDQVYTLQRMATDLRTVLTAAGGRPVVLVGHSIGGMVNLTFCQMYPQLLGSQVKGIVQLDTSYTDPVKTAKNSALNEALQKPVGEPVLHVMIPLSEVVRAMNWVSYEEGLLYLSNSSGAFAGTETRGQLDMVSRYQYIASPAVVARGTLGMFHWDETPELPKISVPVLIIVGNKDTTTLPRASETMKAAIPVSFLQEVGPGNHYSLLERNREVDDLIAQFAGQMLH